MKLKQARIEAGLGRLRCSKLAGIDKPLFYRYEAGHRRPRIDNAMKIARVLGVDLGAIDEFRHLAEASRSGNDHYDQ